MNEYATDQNCPVCHIYNGAGADYVTVQYLSNAGIDLQKTDTPG